MSSGLRLKSFSLVRTRFWTFKLQKRIQNLNQSQWNFSYSKYLYLELIHPKNIKAWINSQIVIHLAKLPSVALLSYHRWLLSKSYQFGERAVGEWHLKEWFGVKTKVSSDNSPTYLKSMKSSILNQESWKIGKISKHCIVEIAKKGNIDRQNTTLKNARSMKSVSQVKLVDFLLQFMKYFLSLGLFQISWAHFHDGSYSVSTHSMP